MLRRVANVNGRITDLASASIPILDRGFLYGDSVYEVFRTYEGVPLFFAEHLDRLYQSADMIGMAPSQSREELTEAIRDTVLASGAADSRTDVYVRYHLSRGVGPIDLFPEAGLRTSFVVIVKEVPAWPVEFREIGTDVAVTSVRRNPRTALDPNIKSGNYLNNVLGVMEARRTGADDCLMLNPQGLLTEASNSNVFVAWDGLVRTPNVAAGILRGLTKTAILSACTAMGSPILEEEIAGIDLERVEEAFLTSATREVMPIRRLRLEDGRHRDLPPGGGPLTRKIASIYVNLVRQHIEAHRTSGYW